MTGTRTACSQNCFSAPQNSNIKIGISKALQWKMHNIYSGDINLMASAVCQLKSSTSHISYTKNVIFHYFDGLLSYNAVASSCEHKENNGCRQL